MAARDRVLLDTCALIWFAMGNERFTPEKIRYVQDAGEEDRLFASVASLWELGYLVRKKNGIQLGVPYRQFWDLMKARINVRPLGIDEAIVDRFHDFADELHNDPADRFILATAIRYRCTLVTGDQKLIAWAQKRSYQLLAL